MKKKPKQPQRDKLGRIVAGTIPPAGAHWPKGRRRNEDAGQWSRTRLALANLIETHWERGRVSNAALATALGVVRNTVARWLDGTDRPSVETQAAIAQWMAEIRGGK